MLESVTDRDPLELLAAEFVELRRQGQGPTISDYVRQYPHLESQIRELFPIIAAMEGVKPRAAEPPPIQAQPNQLERLGDFRVIRELGRGGMGIVYEAEQESLRRRVAVKVLPLPALLEPEHLLRFQREARLAAALHHANIVPVYGIGEADGYHFYAMQFINGIGLDKVLHLLPRCQPAMVPQSIDPTHPQHLAMQVSKAMEAVLRDQQQTELPLETLQEDQSIILAGDTDQDNIQELATTRIGGRCVPVPLNQGNEKQQPKPLGMAHFRQVAHVGWQVAQALGYAHSQGVLHRDIKPGNLLLDQQGKVWVTDFGLAKAIQEERLSRTGDVIGTFRYMAPEQMDGKTDARSDLYSLGLTLYEILTLQPAFSEREYGPLIYRIRSGDFTRPRAINPAIPRDLETILLKCAALRPEDRYQSAAELAADLERFLQDRPIVARRISWAEHAWRWGRRNRSLALSLCVCAVLLMTVLGVSFSQLTSLPDAPEQLTFESTALPPPPEPPLAQRSSELPGPPSPPDRFDFPPRQKPPLPPHGGHRPPPPPKHDCDGDHHREGFHFARFFRPPPPQHRPPHPPGPHHLHQKRSLPLQRRCIQGANTD